MCARVFTAATPAASLLADGFRHSPLSVPRTAADLLTAYSRHATMTCARPRNMAMQVAMPTASGSTRPA